MKCGQAGLLKTVDGVGQMIPFRCKCWRCPKCSPKKRSEVIKLAKSGRPNRLLTLTSNPTMHDTPGEAAQALRASWVQMRRALIEKHGRDKVQFMAVFEQHLSGWPHLHVLLRAPYVAQRWISAFMKRRMNSPIVDIRKINSKAGAGAYVAKYIAKAPERFEGCKRYWTSQNYGKRPPKPAKDLRAKWAIVLNVHQFLTRFISEEAWFEFNNGLAVLFPWGVSMYEPPGERSMPA